MQFVTLCLLMGSLLPFGMLAEAVAQLVQPSFVILAVLGVGSGVDYVVRWGIKAVQESRARKARVEPGAD